MKTPISSSTGKTPDSSKMKLVNSLASPLSGSAGALSMVLAYWNVNDKGGNPKEYKKLLSDSSEKNTIDTVWKIQYDLLLATHPDSEHFMLQLCAPDVQTVPRELFERGEVNDYVPILEQYGFAEPSQDRPILRVAPLFRQFARTWLAKNPDKKAPTEESLITAVCKRFVQYAREVMLLCALAVLRFEPASAPAKREKEDVQLKVSNYYVEIRQLKKARCMLKTA